MSVICWILISLSWWIFIDSVLCLWACVERWCGQWCHLSSGGVEVVHQSCGITCEYLWLPFNLFHSDYFASVCNTMIRSFDSQPSELLLLQSPLEFNINIEFKSFPIIGPDWPRPALTGPDWPRPALIGPDWPSWPALIGPDWSPDWSTVA